MSGMIPGAAGSQEPELEYATKGTSARLVETEAAIQRVRELCESAITDYHRQAAKNGVARAEMARRILRALDGDA